MTYLSKATALIAALVAMPLFAENRIDGQSPDAPVLSAYGSLSVGVRHFDFVNPNQVNILAIDRTADPSTALPLYDRPLAVEMWYPSVSGATGDTSLQTYLRDGTTPVTLQGTAVRDAAALESADPFPLIVLSHGFPGNRFLLSHLAENLASKGYVVASIDHTDSTYNDQAAFGSTLVNRTLDQLFVINEMARLNSDASSGVTGLIDSDNTGLIGYSMGAYGSVITAGAGVTEAAVNSPFGAPNNTLSIHLAGSEAHEALVDPRIKTAIAIAPWGAQFGFFDQTGMAEIEIPMLYIAGSNDVTSGYENGVRKMWEQTINADRALLTFDGGSHNTVAPIPAPEESYYFNTALGFNVSEHYTDPVWDTVFMNNVGQHFATAWLDKYLKGDAAKDQYLDLAAIGTDNVWAGFKEGTNTGIRYETLAAAPAAVPLPASAWLLVLAIGGLGALRSRRQVTMA